MKLGNIPNDDTYYIDNKIVTVVNEKVKIILDLFYNGLETNTLKSISQNEKDNLLIILKTNLLQRVLTTIEPQIFNPITVKQIEVSLSNIQANKKIKPQKSISYSFVTKAPNTPNYISVKPNVLDILLNAELNFTISMLSILRTNRQEILKLFKEEISNTAQAPRQNWTNAKILFINKIYGVVAELKKTKNKIFQKDIYENMKMKRQTFESRMEQHKLKWDTKLLTLVDKKTDKPIY